MSLLTVSRFQGTCVSKLIKWLFLCGSLSAPLDTPLKAVFSLLKVFRHKVWRTWARHDFFWWRGRANPRAHFMFFFMYYLKALSSPRTPSHPPQCCPFWVNTKTKQRALLSSLEKKIKKKLKPRQLCLNSPVLLSTQLRQHLFPLSVVKMQMPSSFFSLLLSLDNCETCYPFLGKAKELFLVGSLQEQQGTKHLLFLDPTVPLSAGGFLS